MAYSAETTFLRFPRCPFHVEWPGLVADLFKDVGEIEHVLTATVCFALVVYACKVFIPDEGVVWCPESGP